MKKITLLYLTTKKKCGKTNVQSKSLHLCPRYNESYGKQKKFDGLLLRTKTDGRNSKKRSVVT